MADFYASRVHLVRDTFPVLAQEAQNFLPIIEAPVHFVREVKTRLFPPNGGPLDKKEILVGPIDLMCKFIVFEPIYSIGAREHICRRALIALIEHGLLDVLLDFIFSDSQWNFPTISIQLTKELMVAVLTCAGQLMRCVSREDETTYSLETSTTLANAFKTRRKSSIARFYSVIWRRRHEFMPLQDRADLNAASAMIMLTAAMDTCLQSRESSLLTLWPEACPVLLYSWSQSVNEMEDFYIHDIFCMFVEFSNANHSLMKMQFQKLLRHREDTGILLNRCTECLRTELVDACLADVMAVSAELVNCCPDAIYTESKDLWIDLLPIVVRACKRQFCSGREGEVWESVMSWSMTCICRFFDPNASSHVDVYRPSGKRSLISMDLLPLVARYSVHAVLHESEGMIVCLENIVLKYQLGLATYIKNGDYRTLAKLYHTSRAYIPQVISDLRKITGVPANIAQIKTSMLLTWDGFDGTLQDRRPAIMRALPFLAAPAPWETCAYKSCMCHEKKPQHKLRVCKGCWKAYYCGSKCQSLDWKGGSHASICRRRLGNSV